MVFLLSLLLAQVPVPDPYPDLPPLSDRFYFSYSLDFAGEQQKRHERHLAFLERLELVYPAHRWRINTWRFATSWRLGYWNRLRDVLAETGGEQEIRTNLMYLQWALGVAYYQGAMPEPFPEIDYSKIPLPPVPCVLPVNPHSSLRGRPLPRFSFWESGGGICRIPSRRNSACTPGNLPS